MGNGLARGQDGPGHRHARPVTGSEQADDGTQLRRVLTYARRGSRLTPRQAAAWERRAEAWAVGPEVAEDPTVRWAEVFGRDAPLTVEIGSGVGETAIAVAAARPEHNVLALEVWHPGQADALARAEEAGIENLRVCGLDAVWAVEHRFADGEIDELLTFFPDPWPKTRHHKRRIVAPDFAARAATRLAVGGWWRLATDWAPYAEVMREVLDAEPALDGGPVERWDLRPLTRFERKGHAAGREVADLAYRRV
ncbi:MAG: tRNA (guanosine(46)-N7)-methyltransferase TrmB [Nocardioides sp.]|nr:tRNA (guanosine(46)-N7)-methyltransferase TrmB [Nocardioides sp.]